MTSKSLVNYKQLSKQIGNELYTDDQFKSLKKELKKANTFYKLNKKNIKRKYMHPFVKWNNIFFSQLCHRIDKNNDFKDNLFTFWLENIAPSKYGILKIKV